MNITKEQVKAVISNNSELYRAVMDMIKARVVAEILRLQVDPVHALALHDVELFKCDKPWVDNPGERIANTDDVHYCEDEAAMAKYYGHCDRRLRWLNIKPDDMDLDTCPALVAENELRKLENRVIELSGETLGITNHGLLCCANGLERRLEYIELIEVLVVNQ